MQNKDFNSFATKLRKKSAIKLSIESSISQSAITCSKLTTETLVCSKLTIKKPEGRQ